ncbi:DUF4214 domain-containing protein [Brevundimonas sp. M1A4_2e]|uniref:DUF4214 domain-containing protein n=1 Tax=Brevundimonas sp. LF-1 TaxID=3126100 RepID=UPI0026EC975C|nr:DUF4214 domain-containing protein [Brevundimonas naejangsanensis]
MSDIIRLPGGVETNLRRLNVGCGFDIRPDYINVDMNDFHSPDVVADIVDLDGFPDGQFDEVFAKDVLEHFLWRMTPLALRSWNRVLRVGGKLVLTTTYLPGLAQRIFSPGYMTDLRTQHITLVNLFSSQGYPGDTHYTAFTERQLRFHAHNAGFGVEHVELDGGWLIRMTMVKEEERSNPDITTGDDGEFVHRMYRDILGREPDAEGTESWMHRLSAGEFDRKGVLLQFIGSTERQEIDMRAMDAFEPGPLTLGI